MLLIWDSFGGVKRLLLAVGVVLLGAASSACTDSTTNDAISDRPTVAVAFYPIEEIVRRVGGAQIDVTELVPPGQEPHEYEPTAQQFAHLEDAAIVFYLGSDFQPNLQKAIESLPGSVRTVDLLVGMTQLDIDDGVDPHVWLDPRNMQLMARSVAETLSEEFPEYATAFAANSATYIDELDALHNELTTGLANCDVPVLITTHEAFAYFAKAYGLTQLAIAGISPGDEPSAKQLETIAQLAADNGVTTVFFEENLPADLAATVADEIGAATSSLGTAETPTQDQLNAGESYLSIMRENLQALRAGLSCT